MNGYKSYILIKRNLSLRKIPNNPELYSQNKTKKVLRLEPISKLKDRMCRIVWQENVQDVIKYSHEESVIRRLEKLLAA